MSSLTEEQKASAKEMFEKFDEDKSGSIEFNELRALLESTLKVKLSDKLYEKYVSSQFELTDKNGDKSLQFDEFLVLYEKLYHSKELPISLKPNEQSSQQPVVEQVKQSGVKPTKIVLTDEQKIDADAKFHEFDKDGSGHIDRDELSKIIVATSKNKLSDMMVSRMVNMQMQVAEKEGRDEVNLDDWYTIYASLFTTGSQPVMGMMMPGGKPPSFKK